MSTRSHLVRAAVALGAFSLALGCNEEPRGGEFNALDLERMIYQARYAPYDPSDLFEDGRVMRRPPTGTIPSDRITEDPALTAGVANDVYVDRVPVEITAELVHRGRARFEATCAACHGLAGDGESHVARFMTLRPPPSLVDARVQAFSPGRIYQVIRDGYGLMRSYAENLPLMDRWAVVAYVKALGASRAVPIDALPAPLRERARKELP
jgi:mono/diheme cytochrome c family protein